MVKAIARTIEQASRRDVNMEALDAINAWIAANPNRFIGAPVSSVTDEQYGAFYGFFQSLDEICIFPNVFRQMLASAGFNEDKTLRFMREKGLIKTEAGKNTIKRVCKNLDFSGRVVCICKEQFLAFLNATPPVGEGERAPHHCRAGAGAVTFRAGGRRRRAAFLILYRGEGSEPGSAA